VRTPAPRGRFTYLALGVASVTAFLACVLGGEGSITGTANVPACRLAGVYDLHATFFVNERTGRSITIRIQDGGGTPEYTDHLYLQIDDTVEVARRLAASTTRDAEGRALVTMPVGQRADGVIVHALFEPTRSCGRTKASRLGINVGLWAYDGTVTFRGIDRGDNEDAGPGAPPGGETEVTDLRIRVHDPRPWGNPAPSGVSASDPVGDGELHGWFHFPWRRGTPAQTFP